MAVLLELSIFSISGEISKRKEVASVLEALQREGYDPVLGAMGTTIQTQEMQDALRAIQISSQALDARRYYIIAKFDCYPEREEMLSGRIESVFKEKGR